MAQTKLNATLGLTGNINLASQVTGALPVANGGTALTSGFVNGGALTEFDSWRKTSAMSGTSSGDFLTNNLERCDTAGFEKIGTGMSESSGVFTFPSTGKWLLIFNASYYSNNQGDRQWGKSEIHTTVDDGTYVQASQGIENCSENNDSCSCITQFLFDVTNVSTHKVKFRVRAENTWYVSGSTDINDTHMDFMKIGDT